MTYSQDNVNQMLLQMGITHAPDHGGWKGFMNIVYFLEAFEGTEKKTYCGWIREYLKRGITSKEQEWIDNGEIRYDDI